MRLDKNRLFLGKKTSILTFAKFFFVKPLKKQGSGLAVLKGYEKS